MADLEWKTLRILIVDPNDFFRTLMRTILRGVHVQHIQEARSERQVRRELLSAPAPHLVLCETELDDGDWKAVAAAISAGAERARLILITSNASRGVIEAAREGGVSDIMVKPISAKQLLNRIARALAAEPATGG
jgi:CheY-like chemotaxis protein